jgi:hypothetical protein
MLAVVLAVLVLLCAGVILYLSGRANADPASAAGMVTAMSQNPSGQGDAAGAPYRRMELDDLMSEGRQTR